MKFEEKINRLEKAISAIGEVSDKEDEKCEIEEMTLENFVEYATEQVEKCISDSAEIKKARIDSLKANIENIKKNFEGPTDTPSVVSVTVYRDKDQKTQTKQEVSPDNATATTGFSSNETQADVQVGKAPSAPLVSNSPAPGTGFEVPMNASFAKALEKISSFIDGADNQKEEAVVEKQHSVIWPSDMNSAFGLGQVENPEVPEWGCDGTTPSEDGYEG